MLLDLRRLLTLAIAMLVMAIGVQSAVNTPPDLTQADAIFAPAMVGDVEAPVIGGDDALNDLQHEYEASAEHALVVSDGLPGGPTTSTRAGIGEREQGLTSSRAAGGLDRPPRTAASLG